MDAEILMALFLIFLLIEELRQIKSHLSRLIYLRLRDNLGPVKNSCLHYFYPSDL